MQRFLLPDSPCPTPSNPRLVNVVCLRHAVANVPPKLKAFLQRWIVNTLAVLVASYVVSGGIHYQRPIDLWVASLVLGLLNAFLRPWLMILSLPLLVFTLGLFTLVINALLLQLVGWLLEPRFRVDSFGDAFWGAVVITVVSLLLNLLTGAGETRFSVRRGRIRRPKNKRDEGDGPVIDV
jgi:putative membrane protein